MSVARTKKFCPSRVRVPRNSLSELGQFTPSTHNLCWGFIHGTYEVEATTNVNPKTKLNQRARKDEPGPWLVEAENGSYSRITHIPVILCYPNPRGEYLVTGRLIGCLGVSQLGF